VPVSVERSHPADSNNLLGLVGSTWWLIARKRKRKKRKKSISRVEWQSILSAVDISRKLERTFYAMHFLLPYSSLFLVCSKSLLLNNTKICLLYFIF